MLLGACCRWFDLLPGALACLVASCARLSRWSRPRRCLGNQLQPSGTCFSQKRAATVDKINTVAAPVMV